MEASAAVDIVVRAVEEHEIPAMIRTDAAGFGEDGAEWGKSHERWLALDLERTACAFEGDDLVGTSRNYSLEVTLPGGAQVPAAGVSAVAVLPTHRRRGILRSMMTRLLDDAVERDEPIAILTASESGIYQRFGFGVTTRAASIDLRTHAIEFAHPRPEGRLRMVAPDDAGKLAPELYDRMRAAYPGAVSRPDAWWSDHHYDKSFGTRFDAVYESPAGALEGYVCYSVKEAWGPKGSDHTISIRDFLATSPDAEHALWRYLCEIDLVRHVRDGRIPVDSPLPWLLVQPREGEARNVHDHIWHRVLDVPTALGARRYAAADRLVLGVHDVSRPGSEADGTFSVDGGPDAAEVTRTGDTADLECGVPTLSSAWLGGVRWSQLAAAGWVVERTPGAIARADAMFASTPLPHGFTDF